MLVLCMYVFVLFFELVECKHFHRRMWMQTNDDMFFGTAQYASTLPEFNDGGGQFALSTCPD